MFTDENLYEHFWNGEKIAADELVRNSRLLFRLRIYRYDKDNGGDDYGNKKYYFETSY